KRPSASILHKLKKVEDARHRTSSSALHLDSSIRRLLGCLERKHQLDMTTGGAFRLRLLHQRHPCSPGRHQADPWLSWLRSRSLERERQLAARLYFYRRRRHVPPTNISVPVTSAGALLYGFVAHVGLGTPPTRQTVLVDTAASFSWDGPRLKPGASRTYRKLPCTSPSCVRVAGNTSAPRRCLDEENRCVYYIKYMDGSIATGASERTRSRSVAEKPISRGSCSPAATTTWACLEVGAYDEGGLEFTPMYTRGSDYYIALTGITVDGFSLEMARSWTSPRAAVVPCYLDLGTEFSVLPSQTYEMPCKTVAERIKGYDRVQSWPGCFEPSYLSTERVIPLVQLHFSNGVRLTLDEQKLMFQAHDGMLCLGFAPGEYYLLGAMQMQMMYAAQDVQKSRMGFSSSI
ncbi:hypothetical protein EJB05_50410, partial [Eragrostis curvula]